MRFVHELFEQRARAKPDDNALCFRDARLSYRELNEAANQLALCLVARGVQRESKVVVCVEPGFDIVVALLAILKAGGVYVPLDPSYPVARVAALLSDTAPALIVTSAELAGKLPFDAQRTLCLDAEAAQLGSFGRDNPELLFEPEQTAYVYYTSGTTGLPKGIVASQSNLASYIGLAQRRYAFTDRDVGPALARFSFSISMFELLSPLVAGGQLLLLERAHVLDLARLSQTLQEVTYFHAGPSLLRSLLRYLRHNYSDFSAFSRVRHASSGGDMVPVEVLEGLREIFSQAEVFVIYGCSEISCMGCTYPVPRGAPLVRSYVGAPFEGMSLRVVDEELRPVPPGVVGEVLFAGPGVVKGYLNRPELSSQKFIELDGQRFYRTGDRGRFSDDGWLELVGRCDFQVKLGGIRIELGEIEHHLRRAPGVENGVVVAKNMGGADADKALVAYVVLDNQADDTIPGIRRYLARQLPDYMVPAVYVELPALPLNHNMKLDRNALPDPPRTAARRAAREPSTPTEQLLASLWARALGVSQVGLDDNFFELGGTSLLALQLIVQVDQALGVTLTGLDILRESLEMQAEICTSRSRAHAREAPEQPAARARADGARDRAEWFELFHFGPSQSLYGALHGPPPPGTASRAAVLICGPLGHEHVRAHFILQQLARKLAAQGVAVLRFDYYGCRDSLGESAEASCSRWQRDIIDAHHELELRARSKRITTLGVRLGATLLGGVASRLDSAKVVLWDPVSSGAQHFAELCEAQRQYLRSGSPVPWRSKLASWRADGKRELLGLTYSARSSRELRALTLPSSVSSRAETITSSADWLSLAHLEDMLPDQGISSALARAILEAS